MTSKMNNELETIDLTNDDRDFEPPTPKISSNGLINRSKVNNLQPCSSKGLIATPWYPKVNKSQEFCIICNSNLYLTPILPCSHSTCHNCFRENILKQTSSETKCVVKLCSERLSDKFVKSALGLDEYVKYLENKCNIFRAVLSQKENDKTKLKKDEAPDKELEILKKLNCESFNTNFFEFECPICMERIEMNDGVILKNCCHSFCKVCISNTIRHSEDQFVICPHRYENNKSCDAYLQEREIRALVSEEVYDQHLKKGLQQAESTMSDVFHCRTPDCDGFIIITNDTKAFPCQICQMINCILCKAIHETKTCEKYKEDLIIDEKKQNELKMTEEAIENMLQKGEAILCANCSSIIQKIDGCDNVRCTICKTPMCYVTGKPRYPLQKFVDGVFMLIDGCHCNYIKGKPCHPNCRGCH